MTDKLNLPALRVAVAETVPYCGQGETVPNAWARRERAERILLDAVPALLDEVEALKGRTCDNDETREYVFTAGWQSARQERPAEYQETEHELRHSAYLYWAAKEP